MNNMNTVSTDILIIGGGPSGLATAIRLADLLKQKGLEKRILLIEKGNSIGSHILSGALICPDVFKELLPDADFNEIPFNAKVSKDTVLMLSKKGKFKMPLHPPYMGNKGNYTASLAEICRYLAGKAVEKGVEIYTGFAMSELLHDLNGNVIGAKTIDTGVDHHGEPMENFQPGSIVEAKLVILAEGSRGSLTKKVINDNHLQDGENPQIYSLGCKELWSVREGAIKPGEVYHTMGYPATMSNVFGGGFIYGLNDNKVSIGLVLGLDYADPTFDTHKAFQIWKTHPVVSNILKDGKMLEYGAKSLPEGGLYSIPKPYTDNVLIVGDSAGFVLMPALKGIHLAVRSGMLAAETALTALEKNDFSEATLQLYSKLIKKSPIYKELRRVRNFRQAFTHGMLVGIFNFGFQILTFGAGIAGKLKTHLDSERTKSLRDFRKKTFKERTASFEFDKVLTFDKVTDVYFSGTLHDENQVPHLQVNNQTTYSKVNIKDYDAPCQYYCPAEVYELHIDKQNNKELRIHFENCLHCKTCDIKEPVDGITWNVPNGGNGPEYKNM
ncbi:MAG: electron transfer flavoprotein-ubiquinone oxidoreductase [Tannerella sp.]|jgi:electron-transferring-flavoprotein dehydrogenase|nr:electron transfer flavoprotein-ubiquinone oxidoreductase [Tannerella sp.]